MNPLIDAAALQARLRSGAPTVLLDCSFELADPGAGERAFEAAHLPGARYAHLDRDLSGPKSGSGASFSGRHPLPTREAFAATLGRLGIAADMAVVVYDRQDMAFAARAWWLLRWIGHADVAVLDGGLAAWQAAAGALETGSGARWSATRPYPAAADPALPTIDAASLQRGLGMTRLIDARAAERFRGDVEPLDPVAGHIPGALNRPYKLNLDASGRFLSTAGLREDFTPLLAGADAVVHQCGSGVTACHNLLAQAVAGLGDGVLYPGSWSQWCADPERPVARG